MRYRYSPEKYKNANYEAFLDRHLRKKPVPKNGFEIDLDDFTKGISFIGNEKKPAQPDPNMDSPGSAEKATVKQAELREQMGKKAKFDLMKRYDRVFGLGAYKPVEEEEEDD